jgi:hypothetical protein
VPVDFSRIQGPARSATENFEKLCALLVALDFPGARAVDGKGGDGGVDAFIPTSAALSTPFTVFQCKLFSERLKGGQKRQIEESLRRAFETCKPGRWILCIPKNLTPSEHVWWDRLQADRKDDLELELWDETTLRQRVLQHPDLREEFFPERFTIAQQRQMKKIVVRIAAVTSCLGLLGVGILVFFPKNHELPSQIFFDPSRPKDLLPQAIYLRHDIIPVTGFPFDLYLGIKLKEFTARYGTLVIEDEFSLLPHLNLYRLKPGVFHPGLKEGWVNEASTVFVFSDEELVVILLSIVVPPETEPAMLGEIDRRHPLGFGTRYSHGAVYIWMSEKGHARELLSLSHGLSSGVNDLALMRTDFPLNDLLLRLPRDVPRFPSVLDADRIMFSWFRSILDSDTYKRQVYPQLGLEDVNREVALRIYDQALDGRRIDDH